MATTSIPSTDSVELKFTLPAGITSATEFQITLTNGLGEVVTDAEPSISVEGGAYTALPANRKFTVALDQRRLKIKIKFKRTKDSNNNVIFDIAPLTNLEWFLEPSFKTVLVFKDNFIINNFTKPNTLVIAEKEVGEIDCEFSYPVQQVINLQVKIAYITANTSNISNLKISFDNGVTYTDLGINATVNVPIGTERLKIKIPTKDDRIITGSDKRFEVVFTENNSPLSTLINQNNKIAVSIRDTSDIPYGTLIRNYCVALDQWGLYANGLGGTYTEIIKIDSFDCGFSYPNTGTVLVSFCAGATRVSHIADGAGNYTKRIDGYESPLCIDTYGSRPITTTVTPTKLIGAGKDGTVLLNSSGSIFTASKRDGVGSLFKTMFGKWYFEVQLYMPQRVHKSFTLGFATEQANLNNVLGADNQGWSYIFPEERKYHNNVKNVFIGRLEVKDRDTVSVLLDNEANTFSLWLNGNDLGVVFSNLSKEKLLFAIGARDDTWAYINFGERGFKYPVPAGYYAGFGEIPNPPLDQDVLIRTYCEAQTLVSVYANGRNGTYVTRLNNSVDCGWVDPRPPKGTILSYFCKEADRWKMVADGKSGSYEQFHEYRSTACGYVRPVVPSDFTPSIWDKFKAHVFTTFDTSMTEANFKGKVYTDLNVDHGVWYIEFTKWDANSYLGIYTDNTFHSSALLTGFIGFDPSTGNVVSDSAIVNITTPVAAGKKIGISLDFLKQESAVYVDQVKVGVIKVGLNHPTDVNKKYGFAASTRTFTAVSVVEANFGGLIFNSTPAGHVPGFGPSIVTFPRRGILLHEFCKDWVLWSIYADGNGGYFSNEKMVNSPTCGWYPDPPVGTVIGEYCQGYTRMQKIATGNYEFRAEVLRINARDCGYIPYGELLETYCQGYTKLGKFSNGASGFYIGVVEYNSVECGSPLIPANTVLREFCAGYSKVQHKADGAGGYYRFVLQEQSVECGYVVPVANTQNILVPTKWTVPNGNNTTNLSNDRRDASALKRDGVRTDYCTLFGKWYFEITVFIPSEVQKAPALGVSNALHNIGNWIGSNKNSWAWWPHDGTKYTNDTQEFYNQGLKIKNQDVISVMLNLQDASKIEFLLNGSPLGVLYSNLPQFDPLYFTFNALTDSYISANFGQNVFKYPVPVGYYPGFGVLNNPPAARGTLLTTFCYEFNQRGEFADGKFGTYIADVKVNAPECGYLPPVPAAGTSLGISCTGFDKYFKIADGAGGFTLELVGINHRDCGYTPPPLPPMTTGFFDKAFAGPTTVVENDEVSATVKGVITSLDNNYSGLWYYEVLVRDLNLVIGYTEGKTNYSLAPGRLANSFGWAVGHNVTILNSIETPMLSTVTVNVNDIVGVFMDYVNETMKVTINGGPVVYTFPLPTPVNTYYLAFGNYDAVNFTSIKVNFAAASIVTSPPLDYQKGWGTPQTRRVKKYVLNTHVCISTTRYKRLNDGNGGFFNELLEANSTLCGYIPPPAVGTVLSYYCVGAARWKRVADGQRGFTIEQVELRSTICGYKPAGALISVFCTGFDKIGNYSDGEFGSYQTTMEVNSRDCGFDDGTGGSNGPGNTGALDPNLPVDDLEGLVYSASLQGLSQSLVYQKPLGQTTTFEEHGILFPIQISYYDYENN